MPILSRRRLLSAAGVSLALPWLEALDPPAEALDPPAAPAGPPGRAIFFMVSSGVNMWRWVPPEVGKGCKLGPTLSVLEPFRDELTVLSGLCHYKGAGGGHYEVGAWLTGNPNFRSAQGPVEPNTLSIDQHIAGAIGDRTRLPCLVLSAPGGSVTTSFDAKGAYVSAENDLRRLFSELFGSADVLALLDRRASVLDLVGAQAKALSGRLGRHDRQRFDEYLASVRDVERRIQADKDYFASKPLAPANAELALDADPAARRAEYWRTMMDLVALALRNDQTRVVSILSAGSQHDFYGTWNEFGGGTHHSAIHDAGTDREEAKPKPFAFVAAHDQWWLRHLTRMLDNLAAVKEGADSLLARTMVLYGSGMSWNHNNNNLPLVLAGGSRLGIRHGHHLRFNPHRDAVGMIAKGAAKADDTTMSDVLRTISERLGVPAAGFGGSTRAVGELLA